jgi:hypothetical protein
VAAGPQGSPPISTFSGAIPSPTSRALYRTEKIAGLLPLASALAALGPDSVTRERQSPRRLTFGLAVAVLSRRAIQAKIRACGSQS